jgi:hypothetical protein
MRKRDGTITGEVRLNGWPQEPISFRRCSGFVEQFDVQSSQLTVRETIIFSARLRLDKNLVTDKQQTLAFVDQVMVCTLRTDACEKIWSSPLVTTLGRCRVDSSRAHPSRDGGGCRS